MTSKTYHPDHRVGLADFVKQLPSGLTAPEITDRMRLACSDPTDPRTPILDEDNSFGWGLIYRAMMDAGFIAVYPAEDKAPTYERHP